ncbi:MAG: site-2 protease family protein [Armatimonadota bacterium]
MSIRLGRLLGIPITVDVSWFVIFALIVYTLAEGYFPTINPNLSRSLSWIGGIIAALLLFASVLVHELMHSVVARMNGMHVGGITLFIFGGVSQLTDEPPTPIIEFKMAIAGPATSISLAFLFWLVGSFGGRALLGDLGFAIVGYLALINLVLGIFNLIPGFPLDGGRVLRSILWGAMNNLERATRAASRVGQGFGYLFIFGGFWIMLTGAFISGLWLVFIGWFLNNAAQQSYQQLQLRRSLSGVNVRRVMSTDFPHVDPNINLDDFVHDYLLKYDYNAFPVTENDSLVGIITVDGVRDVPRDEWPSRSVRSVTKPPEEERIIDENDDAFDALMHMAQGNVRRLLVMDDGKLAGMVTQESIINLVRTKMRLGM